ncbi:hypothetical protein PtrV1_06514 [Pyrenophora tritici-repentis]|nr:hypothetical protein PtrV1_06514 [Pyrenophora tritici-repentis]
MAQPPPSTFMTAEPRRHKRNCWTPLWEYIKMIIRPEANPEDLDFECAGSPSLDDTVPRIPPASLQLEIKDDCSSISTTPEISPGLSLAATTAKLWDEYEESMTS